MSIDWHDVGREINTHFIIARIYDIDRHATIRQGLNCCRRGEARKVPTQRQYYRVAQATKRAIPN